MKTSAYLALVAIFSAACGALGGPLPAPPSGFKVTTKGSMEQMRAKGVGDGVEAEKPNANWPNNCVLDPKLQLHYGWLLSPGTDQLIEMMARVPEEPASVSMGTRDEPAGKRRYHGGVLTWRKSTSLVIGTTDAGCKLKELVTYDGAWVGYLAGKILGVRVWRVYGGKAAGQALIDEYLEKVKSVVAAGS